MPQQVNKFCQVLLRDNNKGSSRRPPGVKLMLDEHFFGQAAKHKAPSDAGYYSDRGAPLRSARSMASSEAAGDGALLSERGRRALGEEGRRASRAVAARALKIAGVITSPIKRRGFDRSPIKGAIVKAGSSPVKKQRKVCASSPAKQRRIAKGSYFGDDEPDPNWRLRSAGPVRNAKAYIPCEGRVRAARLGFPGDIVGELSKLASMEAEMGGAKWEDWELESEEHRLWEIVKNNIRALDGLVMAAQRYHSVLDVLDIHQGSQFEYMLEKCRDLAVKCTDALRDEAAPPRQAGVQVAHDLFGIGERSVITGKLQKQADRIRAGVLALADAGKEHSREVERIQGSGGGRCVMIRRADFKSEELLGPRLAEASKFVNERRVLSASPSKPPRDPLRTIWGTPAAHKGIEAEDEEGGGGDGAVIRRGERAGNKGWAVLRSNAALHRIIAQKDKEDKESIIAAPVAVADDEEETKQARKPLGILQQMVQSSSSQQNILANLRARDSSKPAKILGIGGFFRGEANKAGNSDNENDKNLEKSTKFAVERDSAAPGTPVRSSAKPSVPPLYPSDKGGFAERLKACEHHGPATSRPSQAPRPLFGRLRVRPASAKAPVSSTPGGVGSARASPSNLLGNAPSPAHGETPGGGVQKRAGRSLSVPNLFAGRPTSSQAPGKRLAVK